MEQVFFNVPVAKLEPILKKWFRETMTEIISTQTSAPPPQSERLLTIKEASEFLSLAVPTLYSKVSKGELPVMKKGKRLYFSDSELIAYLKTGRKKNSDDLLCEVENFLTSQKK